MTMTNADRKEWLVSNGLGGYASSTVIGLNTRIYHGLLVASTGGLERLVVVSSLDEEVHTNMDVYRLAVHRYPGVVYPQGFRYLEEFRFYPNPTFVYQAGGVRVVKTLEIWGNRLKSSYQVAGGECIFRVYPLVNLRNFHSVTRAGDISFHQTPARHSTTLISGPWRVRLFSDRAEYHQRGEWYYNFEYDREKERGLAWQEDNYSPGYFEIKIIDDGNFYITAELVPSQPAPNWPQAKGPISGLEAALERTAPSFIVKKGDETTIVAGYHWFSEWGRDAMISLPGLTLVTGRFKEAGEILRTTASRSRGGVIPNHMEGGKAAYNSSDASLWFIYALGEYYRYTGDARLVGELTPTVCQIIEGYQEGTGGIKMEEDCLIFSPAGFTWMDARVNNIPVTPREGKPVEINALWYHALQRAAELTGIEEYLETASRVKKSFQKFWNPEKGCLYDVIDTPQGSNDATVRPNQVFAVFFNLLPLEQKRGILEVVTRELLTPYGLRTLPSYHPDYRGRYVGSPGDRDAAYHQGTVWPWLLGPYITSLIRTGMETPHRAGRLLEPIERHLQDAGLCTISEIFDGDPPHHPRGCISQAWSVAEILRCIREDIKI